MSSITTKYLLAALLAGPLTSNAAVILAVDINSNNRNFSNTAIFSPTFTGFTAWDLDNPNTTVPTTRTFGSLTASLNVVQAGAGSRDRITSSTSATGTLSDFYRDLAQMSATFNASPTTTIPTEFGASAVTVSGLTPNTAYTISVWSFDMTSNSGVVSAWYDMNNAGGTLLGSITNPTLPPNPAAVPGDLSGYTVSGTVLTDATGMLKLGISSNSVVSGTLGRSFLNGLQVSEVPEPSVYAALAGCGALLLGLFHRKRRTK